MDLFFDRLASEIAQLNSCSEIVCRKKLCHLSQNSEDHLSIYFLTPSYMPCAYGSMVCKIAFVLQVT